MSYAVWIALAVVLIAVLPAILRGKKSDSAAGDSTIADGDGSNRDSPDGDSGDGGD